MKKERETMLTRKEVAEWLRISPNTVTKLIRNGEIPYLQIDNGKYLLPESGINAYIKQRTSCA